MTVADAPVILTMEITNKNTLVNRDFHLLSPMASDDGKIYGAAGRILRAYAIS